MSLFCYGRLLQQQQQLDIGSKPPISFQIKGQSWNNPYNLKLLLLISKQESPFCSLFMGWATRNQGRNHFCSLSSTHPFFKRTFKFDWASILKHFLFVFSFCCCRRINTLWNNVILDSLDELPFPKTKIFLTYNFKAFWKILLSELNSKRVLRIWILESLTTN